MKAAFTITKLLLLLAIVALSNNQKLTSKSQMPAFVEATKKQTLPNSESVNTKQQLSLMAFINYSGSLFLGPLCTESMRVALEAIEAMPNLLPKYKLRIELQDDQALSFRGISLGTSWLRSVESSEVSGSFFPAMLGNFGFLNIGQYTQLYNFIMISHVPVVQSSRLIHYNRDNYPATCYLWMVHEFVYAPLVASFDRLGWRKIALLSTGNLFWNRWDYALVDEINTRNMTLLGYLKIPIPLGAVTAFPEDINSTLLDLSAIKEARIIVLHIAAPVEVSCFLFKYKLYGPGYVLLIPEFNSFHKDSRIPYDWCTSSMLIQVLESVIFFGQVPDTEIHPESDTSSVGVTSAYLDDALRSRIEQPELFGKWSMRSACFDMVLLTAYLLNATERVLNIERNETLFDWVVGTRRFRENGSTILQILNTTMYTIELDGLSSKYKYDETTGYNWIGNYPIALRQMQTIARYENGSAKTMAPVYTAMMNASDGSLRFGPGKFEWRTRDEQPPRDSMLVIAVKDLPELGAFVAQVVLASLAITGTLVFLVSALRRDIATMPRNQAFSNRINIYILLGDLLMGSHVFVLPLETSPNIATHCIVAYSLLIVGISTVLAAHAIKLIVVFRTVHHRRVLPSQRSGRHTPKTRRFIPIDPKDLKYGNLFAIVWTVFNGLLVIFWFGMEPFQSVVRDTKLVASAADISLSHQFYTYECQLGMMLYYKASYSVHNVLLAIICTANGVVLIIGMGLSHLLRSEKMRAIADTRLICISVNATVMLVVAGCAISLMLVSSWANMRIAVSLTALSIAACNLIVVFLGRMFTARGTRFV